MEKNMLNYIKFNLLIISICWSQVSVPSTPKSFYTNESIQISNIVLPSFDVEQFLIEDENELRSSDVKPYRFANPILVDFLCQMESFLSYLCQKSENFLYIFNFVNFMDFTLIQTLQHFACHPTSQNWL